MFTYLKTFSCWGLLACIAGLLALAMLFGAFTAWGTAGDPEGAVALYSTGLALSGAIFGGIGASVPSLSKSKKHRERSAKVSMEERQQTHDVLTVVGWGCVIFGAGISLVFQVVDAIQTAAKIMPFSS